MVYSFTIAKGASQTIRQPRRQAFWIACLAPKLKRPHKPTRFFSPINKSYTSFKVHSFFDYCIFFASKLVQNFHFTNTTQDLHTSTHTPTNRFV